MNMCTGNGTAFVFGLEYDLTEDHGEDLLKFCFLNIH